MCGINGIFGFSNLPNSKEVTEQMNTKMKHRGPDAEGVFNDDEQISLGHVRLSIIDLGEDSNQPFKSKDGRYTLVFNGEIYNYKEVKAELSDYNFVTNGDTEVVLAAFMKWGINCCKMFNGMFAFAVWDNFKKELVITRDRLGIKPLYFFNGKNNFIFASEIRSLLECPIIPKKISKVGLADYLRYQTVHAPNTIVDGVEMLPAGSYIRMSEDEISTGHYWSLIDSVSKKPNGKTRDDIKTDVKDLLYKSVERRLMADVPFGAFLSGGIDSSAIVGIMSQISSHKVKTFSVTFAEEKFSEAKYARLVAEKFATDHTEIKLSPADFLKDLPGALSSMDHPSGDGPNTYIVSKVTREAGVTMALSGLGGDELFAGYDIFKRSHQLHQKRWLMSFPKGMRRMAGKALATFKPSVASNKIYEILKGDNIYLESSYPISRQVLLDNQIVKVLNDNKLPPNRVAEMVNELVGPEALGINLPLFSKVSVAEISTYMQHVLLRDSDQMSMASSLEVRVPFLDHELVEYALGIPDDIKFPNYPKQLLVESLDGLLPDEIVHREKMGFVLPWENWMKLELKDFCNERLESLAKRDLFNGDELLALWKDFQKGVNNISWSRLWYLVVLENWMEENNIEG